MKAINLRKDGKYIIFYYSIVLNVGQFSNH